MENENTTPDPTPDRPLGYWLRTVDALLAREFVRTLEGDDVSRRDGMLLNAIDGDLAAPWLAAKLARKGGRLRRLAERGWITETDGGWQLTDEGRAVKERLGAAVGGLRARVSGAVSPADYATTVASLQAIAHELAGDEPLPAGFGRGHRHGFGRRGGFGHGFGPRPGFGPGFDARPGFGPDRDAESADARHGHGFGPHHGGPHGFGPRGFGRGFDPRGEAPCHPGHGEHRHGRGHGERAYERGFTAGFESGRAAASDPAA